MSYMSIRREGGLKDVMSTWFGEVIGSRGGREMLSRLASFPQISFYIPSDPASPLAAEGYAVYKI